MTFFRHVWLAGIGPWLLAAAWAQTPTPQTSTLQTPVAAALPDAGLLERQALGQRIYRKGVGSRGQPIQALGAGQTVLNGAAAACTGCHRRSGYGSSEGQFSVRPITAAALFEEQALAVRSPRIRAQLGTRQRPAYDDALLARALANGLDSAGKPLEPLMPRYALSPQDLQALSAYLATLSRESAPGVDEQEIHFATVIQPGVAPERRRAMLDVMNAFFRDKGANMRQDEARREAGTMRMYRSYRKWVLHVWELSGPSEGWQAQLQSYYQQQPVFALLGGLGQAPWRPIHAFCESLGIPAVLAQVPLPEREGANLYNLYLSSGVTLDAQVLARYLGAQGAPEGQGGVQGPVVQVYRQDASGLAASSALRSALGPQARLQDRVLQGAPDAAFWSSLYAGRPAALVLWLDARDAEGAWAAPATAAVADDATAAVPVYLSFEALGSRLPQRALAPGLNLRLVYPSDLSPRHESRLLRSKIWLHNKGLAVSDEALQVNTLFALTVASDALGHMMDSFSRDYFVERVEHVVGQTPMPSVYQSVSLGPGQRFAVKGSALVQLEGAVPLKALSPWIVP